MSIYIHTYTVRVYTHYSSLAAEWAHVQLVKLCGTYSASTIKSVNILNKYKQIETKQRLLRKGAELGVLLFVGVHYLGAATVRLFRCG